MTEIRVCQNCKQSFTIEPEDFVFYEKLKVPAPTWCPECRFRRRMTWRNDWHVFWKSDARTGKKIFAFVPEESPIKVYERDYWFSDDWDSMEYGRDYDFSRPFFEQFEELLHVVPFPAVSAVNLSSCEYCMNADHLKNCYLVRGATYTEDSAYLIWDHASKECFDSHMTNACELSCGNVNANRCYKTFFSVDCEDCQDVILCKDCVGCNSCLGSVGLRNKSYHLFNQAHAREEYLKKLAELDLGSADSFEMLRAKAYGHWLKFPHKFMHGRQNRDVSGDYVHESKNAKDCFRVRGLEDSKFCQNILEGPVKDCYDYSNWGANANLVYESLVAGLGISNIRFCSQVYPNAKNLEYCIFCSNSSDLFSCIGLRNKQYAILNRQYSKEDYHALREKIIAHMNEKPYTDKAGRVYRYGEFFPPELSYIPYHASASHEFFPLSGEQAVKAGYAWYPVERQKYQITLPANVLQDHIKDAGDDILQEVIGCVHEEKCGEECVGAFRITERELAFYRRMNIPLPRLCPNCRHYARLKQRNPLKLWERQCMCAGAQSVNGAYSNTIAHSHGRNPCPTTFQTSYASDRPEIIYCEQCYNAEVA